MILAVTVWVNESYEEKRGNGILDPVQMTTLSTEWWVAQLGATLLL